MNARLRAFLNEVREWFWSHDYPDDPDVNALADANDLLIAAEVVRREHSELSSIDLLRDIAEANFGEFLYLDTSDRDVRSMLEDQYELEGILNELVDVVVREILRAEDRPEGWESLPHEQQDGPTAKEDKRRLELEKQAAERRLPPELRSKSSP